MVFRNILTLFSIKMTKNLIFLKDKKIIEISGKDKKKFLQGLITNDIEKISENKILYATMLNNQSRFLYDFFIFEKNDTIFLDCFEERIDEIIKKLNFYKLKSDVFIRKNDEIKVFSCLDENFDKKSGFIFQDPRKSEMGYRIYHNEKNDFEVEEKYHYQRILLKLCESEYDLTYEKSIINEFGFDEINAIDYQKGCYIGQELIARTHHLGQIRKKIFHIEIDDLQEIQKNCEIYCQGKKVGLILFSIYFQNKLNCLAIIKIVDENLDFDNLFVNDNVKLKIIK